MCVVVVVLCWIVCVRDHAMMMRMMMDVCCVRVDCRCGAGCVLCACVAMRGECGEEMRSRAWEGGARVDDDLRSVEEEMKGWEGWMMMMIVMGVACGRVCAARGMATPLDGCASSACRVRIAHSGHARREIGFWGERSVEMDRIEKDA